MRPADSLFSAQISLGVQEGLLIDFLGENGLLIGDEDPTWDYYDRSIEFHEVVDGTMLSGEQIKLLLKYGFDKCWLRYMSGVTIRVY